MNKIQSNQVNFKKTVQSLRFQECESLEDTLFSVNA